MEDKQHVPFDELLEDRTKEGTKLQTSEYSADGLHPIIDQGQKDIAGYTDREDGIFPVVPCIVFGDHTRVIKYVDKPFFLGADGVKVLCPKTASNNTKYLYYALNSVKIPDTGYNRHYKWLKEARITVYSKEKQDKLVSVFELIDDLISLRKKQLQKLDDLVKSRFVEMFGDLRSNPMGWDLYTFDEITDYITDGEHATPRRSSEGIYLLSARNILNHALRLDDVDHIDQAEYDRIAKRVIPREGDVLVSCSGTVGRCCTVPAGIAFQMVRSAALLRFKPTVLPLFAEYMITSDFLQEQIGSSKTASSQANLFQGKIAKLKGIVPPMDKQIEFVSFVKHVDKSRLTIQDGLNRMELLKQSLMQKFFG